jgi:hypothetical protein
MVEPPWYEYHQLSGSTKSTARDSLGATGDFGGGEGVASRDPSGVRFAAGEAEDLEKSSSSYPFRSSSLGASLLRPPLESVPTTPRQIYPSSFWPTQKTR